jgi:uncharacterized membrane protein YfcA
MDNQLISLWLGGLAALMVGFSKTGMPGAAIPAVALMAEAFREDTRLSVGALLPMLIVGDLFAVTYYRRHAQWDRLWKLVPYVALGMIPGYLVLRLTEGSSDSLRRLIGIIIVLLLSMEIARKYFGWEKMPDRWWFVGTAGGLAGFGTTVGNAAGPVMSIYLASIRLDKYEFLGTAAWFFFFVNLSKLPVYYSLNMMTQDTLRLDLMIAPAVVVGALIGVTVLKRMPQALFNVLVLFLAGIAALRMVFF